MTKDNKKKHRSALVYALTIHPFVKKICNYTLTGAVKTVPKKMINAPYLCANLIESDPLGKRELLNEYRCASAHPKKLNDLKNIPRTL